MTDELLPQRWATLTVTPGLEGDLQCRHTSLVCFFISLSHPFFTHLSPHSVFPPLLRPDTFYSSLSYLCLHLASFLWISVFSQMVLSTPRLYTRLSITLSRANFPPCSFRLVSSCLILCWFFRQLMENKITTIERGSFQDLKELERLWVHFLSSNQFFLRRLTHKWGKRCGTYGPFWDPLSSTVVPPILAELNSQSLSRLCRSSVS